MVRLKGLAGGVGGALALALYAAFLVLQIGLFVGGISYRKECLNADGRTVSKNWEFTLLAPIPYLFRPSEDGCVVHTGTSVALDVLGVATFAPTTPELIARRFADETPRRDAAYLGQVKVVLADFVQAAPRSAGFTEAIGVTAKAERRLAALDPPPRLSDLHGRLLGALDAAKTHAAQAQDAIRNRERRAYNDAVRQLQSDNTRMIRVLRQVNREIAAL